MQELRSAWKSVLAALSKTPICFSGGSTTKLSSEGWGRINRDIKGFGVYSEPFRCRNHLPIPTKQATRTHSLSGSTGSAGRVTVSIPTAQMNSLSSVHWKTVSGYIYSQMLQPGKVSLQQPLVLREVLQALPISSCSCSPSSRYISKVPHLNGIKC